MRKAAMHHIQCCRFFRDEQHRSAPAKLIGDLLREAFKYSPLSRFASVLALTSLRRLQKRIDPRRVNGGVFLGLNGTVVKSHGSADATGISAANDNWPHFRGPTMNATVADNPNLPETWSQTENVEWVADIPGIGWSSPVVWGNRVFLTTVTAVGEFEQPKPGLYAPNGRPIPPPLEHDWLVFCLDLESGDVLRFVSP